jgi:hypothetical protein
MSAPSLVTSEAIIATVAVLGLVGTLLVWFGKGVRALHKRLSDLFDDWSGRPGRPGVEPVPGVMESLSGLKSEIAVIKSETLHNGGTSLKDAITRIEVQLAEHNAEITPQRERFQHDIEELKVRVEELWRDHDNS